LQEGRNAMSQSRHPEPEGAGGGLSEPVADFDRLKLYRSEGMPEAVAVGVDDPLLLRFFDSRRQAIEVVVYLAPRRENLPEAVRDVATQDWTRRAYFLIRDAPPAG
jgi:hypothetical protein